MKNLLLLLLLLSSFNCTAQYSRDYKAKNNKKEYVLPLILLTSTAITVDVISRTVPDVSVQTLDSVALTGIAISLMSIIVIEQIKSNPPKKVYRKRIKRLSRL